MVFVHVGEVETFHGEAQAEFKTANVVALRNECVAVAIEVDELVKQFKLLACQHGAQLIVNSRFAFVNVGVLLRSRRGYNLFCKVAVKNALIILLSINLIFYFYIQKSTVLASGVLS